MNTKLLLAPVLAVLFALMLAGAISVILPQNQQQNSFSADGLNSGQLNSTPLPSTAVPAPTAEPQPAASMASLYYFPTFLMFVAAAVIVGIAVVLLFFREKNLDKD